jgi:hypothetical protein
VIREPQPIRLALGGATGPAVAPAGRWLVPNPIARPPSGQLALVPVTAPAAATATALPGQIAPATGGPAVQLTTRGNRQPRRDSGHGRPSGANPCALADAFPPRLQLSQIHGPQASGPHAGARRVGLSGCRQDDLSQPVAERSRRWPTPWSSSTSSAMPASTACFWKPKVRLKGPA